MLSTWFLFAMVLVVPKREGGRDDRCGIPFFDHFWKLKCKSSHCSRNSVTATPGSTPPSDPTSSSHLSRQNPESTFAQLSIKNLWSGSLKILKISRKSYREIGKCRMCFGIAVFHFQCTIRDVIVAGRYVRQMSWLVGNRE